LNEITGDKEKIVLLPHGDGGAMTRELIDNLFLKYFRSPYLADQSDATSLPGKEGKICVTTDSFVVDPIFFPGGDIGKLSICGTVNDLAVCGAIPEYIAASFILEEGLPLDLLEKIVVSMKEASLESGVAVIAGDTKVVPRGCADKIFITTTGIGYQRPGIDLGARAIKPGDVIMVNGSIGDHGLAIMLARENMGMEGIVSDCAPLNGIIGKLLDGCGSVRIMRDLTRGGLATCLKEIVMETQFDAILYEDSLPVSPRVAGAAEILGLDPLYLANEGKFLAVVDGAAVISGLDSLLSHPLGRESKIVGRVVRGKGNLYLKTPLGGTRVLSLMAGMPLPRIC